MSILLILIKHWGRMFLLCTVQKLYPVNLSLQRYSMGVESSTVDGNICGKFSQVYVSR